MTPAGHHPSRPTGRTSRVLSILVVCAIVAGLAWATIALAPHLPRERIERWVRDAGVWGPLLLLAIQAAQILVAPIPGFFVPVLAGILYGPFLGPVLTTGGTLIGSVAAYWIGRSGRPLAERLIGDQSLAKAQDLLKGRRWLALVMLFLVPFSPSDALCFVAGIVRMEWKYFMLAVALGRVPKDAAVTVATALGFRFLH